ncbi:MAG: 2-oxoglutarate dehydrogenase E1 subunit family protein [Chitinophagaceae bacterium]
MKDFSYITHSHPSYIENLYKDYVQNPENVDPEFRKFFEGFDFALSHGNGHTVTDKDAAVVESAGDMTKEFAVYNLIIAYRYKGHLIAHTNPIRARKDRGANLDLNFFGLSDADLSSSFAAGSFIGLGKATLNEIIEKLKKIYTSSVGIQYKYITRQDKLDWLEKEFEDSMLKPISNDIKRRILEKLNHGVIFEKFLHTKYIGQKRFSLEGGETTIAALDSIINTAAEYGVMEVVLGMVHRGR